MTVNTIDRYLDLAREFNGASSDRKLAKLIGVTPATVSAWRQRRQWPDEKQMLALCRIAQRAPDCGLMDLNTWRGGDEARPIYEEIARKITGTTAALMLAAWTTISVTLALAASPANASVSAPSQVTQGAMDCILCII